MAERGRRVLVALRKMIASGQLPPGARVAEVPISDRLGVSRTPVRLALRVLEQEGLLEPAGARGYVVRAINAEDIAGAIEVRGVLEGLAVRQITERGLERGLDRALRRCLEEGDKLFKNNVLTEDDLVAYGTMNSHFHRLIVRASANRALAAALRRNDHFPFASIDSIAAGQVPPEDEFKRFQFAHLQHHLLVDAMAAGEAARAEALMREHAHAALRYAEVFGRAAPPDRLRLITAA